MLIQTWDLRVCPSTGSGIERRRLVILRGGGICCPGDGLIVPTRHEKTRTGVDDILATKASEYVRGLTTYPALLLGVGFIRVFEFSSGSTVLGEEGFGASSSRPPRVIGIRAVGYMGVGCGGCSP